MKFADIISLYSKKKQRIYCSNLSFSDSPLVFCLRIQNAGSIVPLKFSLTFYSIFLQISKAVS